MKKIGLILLTVLIITGFGVIILRGSFFTKKEKRNNVSPTATPTSKPILKEEGVEVSLTPRYDNRAVTLKLSKISSEIVSFEYELSYETKGGLPRGVLTPKPVEVKGQDPIVREILLGSCSKNVCVYDEGVKKISLTLKFNKTTGVSTSFVQEYEL